MTIIITGSVSNNNEELTHADYLLNLSVVLAIASMNIEFTSLFLLERKVGAVLRGYIKPYQASRKSAAKIVLFCFVFSYFTLNL